MLIADSSFSFLCFQKNNWRPTVTSEESNTPLWNSYLLEHSSAVIDQSHVIPKFSKRKCADASDIRKELSFPGFYVYGMFLSNRRDMPRSTDMALLTKLNLEYTHRPWGSVSRSTSIFVVCHFHCGTISSPWITIRWRRGSGTLNTEHGVTDESEAIYGYAEMLALFQSLHVVINNRENSVGGGSISLQPPPISSLWARIYGEWQNSHSSFPIEN